MSTARSVPAGNGVAWLTRGFGTVRKHPGTLSVVLFLFFLAILAPVCIQLAAQFLMAGTVASLAVQLLAAVAMMLIAALLQVGILRLIDTLERTGTGSAASIFATFSDTDLIARALVFALIVVAVSIALIVVVLLALGPDMLGWYKTVLTQPMAAAAAAPPITRSPWLSAAIGLVGGIALFGVNTFGYAQVALTRTGGVEAFKDGLDASARNVLPIILNVVVVIVTLIVLLIPMLLLMLLVGFIGGLVHPLAGAVLILPIYFAYLIAMCALIYATMYHAWRDVFGDGAVIDTAPSPGLQA